MIKAITKSKSAAQTTICGHIIFSLVDSHMASWQPTKMNIIKVDLLSRVLFLYFYSYIENSMQNNFS